MTIDLQLAGQSIGSDVEEIPRLATIERWVTETFLAINRPPANLTIRVVNEEEMIALNHRYRGKNNPTNVLAFPFESVAEVDYPYLGDIVICFAVVKKESNQHHKSVQSHFARMVIHGTLHLCGFDHQTDDEAVVMEGVEQGILATISNNLNND